jgi:ribosome modulation factor
MGDRRGQSRCNDKDSVPGPTWRSEENSPFTPEKRKRAPGTHWIGGWVGPRADLESVLKTKISCPCRESNPGRPACHYQIHHVTSYMLSGQFWQFRTDATLMKYGASLNWAAARFRSQGFVVDKAALGKVFSLSSLSTNWAIFINHHLIDAESWYLQRR